MVERRGCPRKDLLKIYSSKNVVSEITSEESGLLKTSPYTIM